MTSTLAHKIPTETIVIIVREALQACCPLYGERDKKQLGVYCLVCRYWARIARPAMFWTLVLRTGADLDTLLQLILSPPVALEPALAVCIHKIKIALSGPWKLPWIHRVPGLAQHVDQELTFDLRVGDLKERGTTELLSTSLPRTLPRSTFLFVELDLADVHFRKVSDLVRTIRDLLELETLRCRGLSFDDASLLQVGTPPRRREAAGDAYKALEVSAKECGGFEMEKELMFLLLFRTFQRRYAFKPLSESIWQAFREIYMALKTPSTGDPGPSLAATGPSITFRDRDLFTLRLKRGRRSAISISLELESQNVDLTSCDWDAVQTAITRLNPVPLFQLSATHKSCFKTILDAVLGGKILAHMNQSRRLNLEYFPPKGGMSIDVSDVLTQPTEREVDGRRLSLSPSQRFELVLCKDEGEMLQYLRSLVKKDGLSCSSKGAQVNTPSGVGAA